MKHGFLASLLLLLALPASALPAPDSTATRDSTALPDYAGKPEQALIDRLARAGALPPEEALHVYPDDRAQRGDLAYWLGRALGWHERKLSGAFPDVPDSLEPWVDALARRHVLDTETRTAEFFQPYAPLTLPTALAWCTAAARAQYKNAPADSVLRRALVANTSLASRPPSAPDTLTRAQTLGMVANVRFLNRAK
jgi:hypothetical protein